MSSITSLATEARLRDPLQSVHAYLISLKELGAFGEVKRDGLGGIVATASDENEFLTFSLKGDKLEIVPCPDCKGPYVAAVSLCISDVTRFFEERGFDHKVGNAWAGKINQAVKKKEKERSAPQGAHVEFVVC